jgi:hypothetical protein
LGKSQQEDPRIDRSMESSQVWKCYKVKNWKELIGNRKEWNNLVEKAKTHTGL